VPSGRHVLVLCMLYSALTLTPRSVTAQTVVRPHASALWVAVPSHTSAATSVSAGSARAKGALLGALLGAALGGLAGHTICHRFGSNTADHCTGDTLWWGALGGALGLLVGAAADREADR
jgi:hypothetical protein